MEPKTTFKKLCISSYTLVSLYSGRWRISLTNVRSIRQRPVRRSRHSRTWPRKRHSTWRGRLILWGLAGCVALLSWAILARRFAPTSNTSLNRFDAIVVLGYKADSDGNPTPTQLARVTEAVREYELGVAPRLIMTGGAVANRFDEAQVMARTAEAQGIPSSAILVEPAARDTMENACFSARILKQHGWRSAEVISSAQHLPRAGMIFSRLGLEWRTHAAPPLSPGPAAYAAALETVETLKTVRYLVWSRWVEQCEP